MGLLSILYLSLCVSMSLSLSSVMSSFFHWYMNHNMWGLPWFWDDLKAIDWKCWSDTYIYIIMLMGTKFTPRLPLLNFGFVSYVILWQALLQYRGQRVIRQYLYLWEEKQIYKQNDMATFIDPLPPYAPYVSHGNSVDRSKVCTKASRFKHLFCVIWYKLVASFVWISRVIRQHKFIKIQKNLKSLLRLKSKW